MKSAFRHPAQKDKKKLRNLKPRIELDLTWLSILLTLFVTVMAMSQLFKVFIDNLEAQEWIVVATQPILWVIIFFYVYGSLVYQITRLGYLRRGIRHHPPPPDLLNYFLKGSAPELTILIPSYKEQERIVFNTLMSVALQTYPKRRVVLLVDDPPQPGSKKDLNSLEATRNLPTLVTNILQEPRCRLSAAMANSINRKNLHGYNPRRETAILASMYAETANWFKSLGKIKNKDDHADQLFVKTVLQWHHQQLQDQAKKLADSLEDPYLILHDQELISHYQRLISLFTVEVTSFERKRYENLSHEPNKAMNLNSYIGLVGKYFRERNGGEKHYLEEVKLHDADFHIPDADYFITLDADSLITPDYALRLIHYMEQPENQKVAVAQTPYNSIPNAPTALERIAGATTDIQYIIHQGFTEYDATYWVGANALLRKKALLDIAVEDRERNYPIRRYIQDRTVIEDTESSLDLIARGWDLYNYPERLSFSATPPDFGSLIIQRRRWANGGLIILPKIRKLLDQKPLSISLISQFFMRVHYLVSITSVNVGLLLWLLLPSGDSIQTLWLPFTALPYYLLYTRDLRLLGYHRRDILSVYALNLLLIPVNLAGVFKSVEQLLTQKKIPFGRTPKVQNRTAAAPTFILVEYLLLAYWFFLGLFDLVSKRWLDGAFGVMNASFLFYAILRFIGLRESLQDLFPTIFKKPTSRGSKKRSPSTSKVSEFRQ